MSLVFRTLLGEQCLPNTVVTVNKTLQITPEIYGNSNLRGLTPHAALIPCATGGCENTPQN
jgi:hypothetical protein